MTLASKDYAELAEHSYDRKSNMASLVKQTVSLGGVEYRILAYSDKPSGYQGTIYQCKATGEIVVAHRGTEFERQRWDDLIKTDGGMVVRGVNAQADDAIALTLKAKELAQDSRERYGHVSVTTTGHSLGGTLAQITAHRFNIGGETFNAYGARGLDGVPREGGGERVLNHVIATDLVSSGAPHFGRVRVYAREQDTFLLHNYGYENTRSQWDARDPISVAVIAMRKGAHDMHNFLPIDGDGRRDRSILNDESARTRAASHDARIDKFRDDVGTIRQAISDGARNLPDTAQGMSDWLRRRSWLSSTDAALASPAALGSDAQGAPSLAAASSNPSQPGHPLHDRYCKAYEGVCAIDQAHGRMPDDGSRRMAAALAAESTPLRDLGSVLVSDDRQRVFAVDTVDAGSVHRQRVHVEIATAIHQPLEVSHARWQALDAEQQQRALQTPVVDQNVARSVA